MIFRMLPSPLEKKKHITKEHLTLGLKFDESPPWIPPKKTMLQVHEGFFR